MCETACATGPPTTKLLLDLQGALARYIAGQGWAHKTWRASLGNRGARVSCSPGSLVFLFSWSSFSSCFKRGTEARHHSLALSLKLRRKAGRAARHVCWEPHLAGVLRPLSLSLLKGLGSELPRYPSHLSGLLLLWGFGKLVQQGSDRRRRGGAGERRAGAEGNGGQCDPFRATGNVQHTANKQAAAEVSWLPGSGKWRGRGWRRVSTEVARLWSCTAGHGGRTEGENKAGRGSVCLVSADVHVLRAASALCTRGPPGL